MDRSSRQAVPVGRGTRTRASLLAIIFLVFTGAFSSCTHKKDNTNLLLLWLLLKGNGLTPADYYAKIYYLDPLVVGAPANTQYVWEATSSDVHTGKKKLILVHGWQYQDRDTAGNYPTSEALKARILSLWAPFFPTTEYSGILAKGYDVYAFDYLTAAGVDGNGSRFRGKLDSLFGNSTESVIIFAHSMGGLVSRFAIYNSSKPGYRVITAGTPFHGSPWASPEFVADRSFLGALAAFMTDSDGGHDLAWDNFDSSLPGASNPKLSAINGRTDRDDLFVAYYGAYNQSASNPGPGAGLVLIAGCPLLGATFAPSDCIVPKTSATLSGHTLSATWDTGSAGSYGYDHFDVNLGVQPVRNRLLNTDLP